MDAADFRQHATQAVSEAEHVDHRIGEIAQDGGHGELAPDQEVAPPDRDEAETKGL